MSEFADVGDLRVHHALSGPAGAPLLVLSHSLGADLSMWHPQVPELEKSFRVLRYDTRGQGRTSVTPGPYTIERLAGDVIGLLDALGLKRGHICGLSMGGMIGMWLAAHEPERVERLVLCSSGARIGTPDAWNARIDGVRRLGMRELAPSVVQRWFTPECRARSPATLASALRMLEGSPPEGYAACCAAIRDADLSDEIGAIGAPTLVIAGGKDPAAPPAEGRFLADHIPGARYVELAASHLSNLEVPSQFTAEIVAFLSS